MSDGERMRAGDVVHVDYGDEAGPRPLVVRGVTSDEHGNAIHVDVTVTDPAIVDALTADACRSLSIREQRDPAPECAPRYDDAPMLSWSDMLPEWFRREHPRGM